MASISTSKMVGKVGILRSNDETVQQFTSDELKEHASSSKGPAKKAKDKALSNPDIQSTILDQGAEYFLGYASYCPLLGMDLDGPDLDPIPNQRPLDSTNTNKLWTIAGEQGQGLLRMDSNHALIILVDPKDITTTCLTHNTTGPFSKIQWTSSASKSHMFLTAGQHRVKVLSKLLEPYLKHHDKLKGEDQEELKAKILDQGSWLVSWYSLELLKDKLKGQTLQLQLFTNLTQGPMRDSPSHWLSTLLRRLRSCQSNTDKDSCMAFVHTTTSTDVKTLITKYPGPTDILGNLYCVEPFNKDGLTPKEWLDSQKTIWGFLEPFIEGGLYQLLYLSTTLELPSSPAEDKSLALFDLIQKNLEHKSPVKMNPSIASALVEMAEEEFTTYLLPYLEHFGLKDSSKWNQAVDKFHGELSKTVAEWIEQQISAPADTWKSKELKIIKMLSKKASYIFNNNMASYPLFPPLGCNIPLICPGFVKGLNSILNSIAPAIRFTASLFVPTLIDQASMRNGKQKSDSTTNFLSDSESLFYSLQYFNQEEDEEEMEDWASTPVPQFSDIKEDDTLWELCMEASHLSIVAQFFHQRAQLLLPNMPAIHTANTAKLSDPSKEEVEKLVSYMHKWVALAKGKAKANCKALKKKFEVKNLTLRMFQDPLLSIPDLQEDEQPTTLQITLQGGLSCSYFSWFRSENGNNDGPLHTRFAKNLLHEAFHSVQRSALIEEETTLLCFVGGLQSLINKHTGLEEYKPWHPVPEPSIDDWKWLEESKGSSTDLLEEVKHSVLGQKLDKQHSALWTNLLTGLGKPGISSAPTSKGPVLHPLVEYHLYQAFHQRL
ncbi:hypothetical protein C8R45DRAFT_1102898 [Mycena sanguinolenta]|nr:hypothetical protein C8R45DRAFT_1102898 [Mycena sanguinolenta]